MKKFLLSMAAVALAISASAKTVVDYEIDYSKTDWNFYVMGYTPVVVDGVLTSEFPGDWYQYFIADLIKTTPGTTYTVTVNMRTSSPATLGCNMGWGWGEGEIINNTIETTTEFSDCVVVMEEVNGTSSNIVLQPGMYEGKVEVKKVTVTHEEAEGEGPQPGDEIVDYQINYADTDWNFYVMGYTPVVVNGVLTSEFPGDWYQYFIADLIPTTPGTTYTVTVNMRTSAPATLGCNMGWGWGEGEIINNSLTTTTEFKDCVAVMENVQGTSSNIVLQPGMFEGVVEVKSVTVSHKAGENSIKSVAIDNGEEIIYNLQGVRVDRNHMNSGIYIINGKKTYIRR